MKARRLLAGVRILVGRARHQASALSVQLKALGAQVIEIPFIQIRPPRSYRPLDTALKHLDEYDWLILTSVNGVDAVAQRMKRLRILPASFKHPRIAAIGPATATRIKALGLKVTVVPKRYMAEFVIEALRGKVEEKRVLLARAKVARDVIPRQLRKMGAQLDVVETYETAIPASSRKRLRALMKNLKQRPHVVTFTSSSSVRNFVALLGGRRRPRHMGQVQVASIGPITSATLRELGFRVHCEAQEYTIPGLVRAIVAAVKSSR
jgi:uroporphyrinogen-III synthase